MEIFATVGYLGFILSLGCVYGIAYHKKRITELTFAVGYLMDELEELKNIK